MHLAEASVLRGLEGGLLYTALGVFCGATAVGVRVLGGLRRGRALRTMVLVGTTLLTLALALGAWRAGRLPLVERSELLLFIAWGVALLLLAVDRRAESPVLAAAIAPGVALLLVFAILLLPEPGSIPPPVRTAAVWLHILLAVMGCAAITFAAATGVLYLRQIRALKSDPAVAVNRSLPALESLDRLNSRSAALGVLALCFSLIVGWAVMRDTDVSTKAWFLDPTVLAVSVGLLVYALLFGARAWLGWRGRRAAWLTVVGFFLVVVGGAAVAAFCAVSVHQT